MRSYLEHGRQHVGGRFGAHRPGVGKRLADNHHDKFTSYSDRNERTQSKRYDNTSPPAETSPGTNYDGRYWYDTAGNPIKHKRGTDPNTPATYNALNLCTSVGDPNDPDAEFSYDDDHNLTLDTADRAKLGIATR